MIVGRPETENNDFKSILVVTVMKILILGAPGKENIDFWWSTEHTILIFGGRGQNILIFCRPEKENNDFSLILVIRGEKILIFGDPGTENIDFRCSGERKY